MSKERRSIPSLDAHRYLRATMTACSFQKGWRSLLLRTYDDPAAVEQFTTPPTTAHLVVLVTRGACDVEGSYGDKWQKASYRPGSIGMTAAGERATLRWNGTTEHSTIQLHIPATTLQSCAEDLLGAGSQAPQLPSALSFQDPLLREVILGVAEGLQQGAPDLYADSAAHFIAMHLLVRHAGYRACSAPSREEVRMRRVRDYLLDHLGDDLSLEELARVAALSRFHLIRSFKQTFGATPFQYLTQLRIEEACRRLATRADLVATIATDCGFGTQAHFAAVFRRWVGVSPTAYRQQVAR